MNLEANCCPLHTTTITVRVVKKDITQGQIYVLMEEREVNAVTTDVRDEVSEVAPEMHMCNGYRDLDQHNTSVIVYIIY